MTIVTSTGPGGTYDLIARLVAKHMAKYVPGTPPSWCRTCPAAATCSPPTSCTTTRPRTALSSPSSTTPFRCTRSSTAAACAIDADKFTWLGSPGDRNSVTFVWHTAGIKTIQDAMKKEVALGGTGVGSSIVIFPTAMNKVLGTKFKIVMGYRSSAEVFLAMERGEVQARSVGLTSVLSEYPEWIKDKKIVFLAQMGAKRDPLLPTCRWSPSSPRPTSSGRS
jgi:tripartite-type tricarboxylate transporter receptor subunit TctC